MRSLLVILFTCSTALAQAGFPGFLKRAEPVATLSMSNSAQVVSIPGAGTFVKITGWTSSPLNIDVTFAGDSLKFTRGGVYLVVASFSVDGQTAADSFVFLAAVNGVKITTYQGEFDAATANATYSVVFSGLYNVPDGGGLSFWAKNNIDADDPTIRQATIAIRLMQ